MWKRATFGLLALGLIAAAGMVFWQGAGAVLSATAAVGWAFLPVCAWYALAVLGMGWSWALIFPPGEGPPWPRLVYVNYLGATVNALLPVAAVGGEVLKAFVLAQREIPGPLAGASVVADKAAQAASQLAFGLIGIGALIYLEAHGNLIAGLLIATLLFCVLLGAFFWVQGQGTFFRLARRVERWFEGRSFGGRAWWRIVGGAASLDHAFDRIYRRHTRIALACGWRLAVRFLFVAETWYLARAMGYPIGWVEALMLESLTQSVRGMAFVVPSGLGAQEGAFLLFAHSAGLPAEAALALSLVKRAREVVCGAPALLILQWGAGRHLAGWRRRA
jgi:putative membrane protein